MTFRQLFGGAITCTIPEDYADASMIRQIPDNQEVFVHSKGDDSIIVELLQMEKDVPDDLAALHHFKHLAEDNEAQVSQVSSAVLLPRSELQFLKQTNAQVYVLTGAQKVSKFNETAGNTVEVYLALVRLPDVTTDLLITLNQALEISQHSSSAGTPISSSEDKLRDFTSMVMSLRIVDWGLFAADPVDGDDGGAMDE